MQSKLRIARKLYLLAESSKSTTTAADLRAMAAWLTALAMEGE